MYRTGERRRKKTRKTGLTRRQTTRDSQPNLRRRALLAPTTSSSPLRTSVTVTGFLQFSSLPLTPSLSHSLSSLLGRLVVFVTLSSKRTTNPVGSRMFPLFVSRFSFLLRASLLLPRPTIVCSSSLSFSPSSTPSSASQPPLAGLRSCFFFFFFGPPVLRAINKKRETKTGRVAHGTGIFARFVSSTLRPRTHETLSDEIFRNSKVPSLFAPLPFFAGIFVHDDLTARRDASFPSSRFRYVSLLSYEFCQLETHHPWGNIVLCADVSFAMLKSREILGKHGQS